MPFVAYAFYALMLAMPRDALPPATLIEYRFYYARVLMARDAARRIR